MPRTLFKDANVLDGDRPAQPGTTVVVDGNRIVEVSTQPVGVQPDDIVHDLRGYTIMPGLGMGHFHAEFHHMDMQLLKHVYNGAERPTGVLMAVAINTCRMMVESGYTMAVSAACSNDLDACLKMSMEEDLIVGPRLQACSPHLETTGNERPHWWYDSHNTGMQIFIDGPDAFRREVRTQIRRGADWIKILPTGGHGITEPHLRRISSDEIRRRRRHRARNGQARPSPRRLARADRRVRRGRRRPHRPRRRGGRGDHRDDGRAWNLLGPEHARPRRGARHLRRRRRAHRRPRLGDDQGRAGTSGTSWPRWCRSPTRPGIKILPGDDYGVPIIPHALGAWSADFATYVDQVGIKPLDTLRWATRQHGQPDADGGRARHHRPAGPSRPRRAARRPQRRRHHPARPG